MTLNKIVAIVIVIICFSFAFGKEEKEQNNTEKKACVIYSGDVVTGHTGLKTDYGFTGDIDLYRIDVSSPGILTISGCVHGKFGSSKGEPSVRIDVFNGDEVKAGEWKNLKGKKDSPVYTENKTVRYMDIRKAGVIYLKVEGYNADAYYEFAVSYKGEAVNNEVKTISDPVKEVESNDTPDKAMKIDLREPVMGNTGKVGKYGIEGNKDYYSVEVPGPGKLTAFVNITGKYGDDEGEPSIKLSFVNKDEMASGEWKNIKTGEDVNPIFYKGTRGICVFIKTGGNIILMVDRYGANAKYKLTVMFE